MINVIINGIINFFNTIILISFQPVWNGVQTILDSLQLTQYITLFNNVMSNYVFPSISFVLDLIPPNTLAVVVLWLSCLVLFFNLSLLTHLGLLALKIIKKLPLA